MASIISFFPNSSSYHGTPGTKNLHATFKTKYVSSWDLQVKALANANASRNGDMIQPANTTVIMKARMMMMDRKKKLPDMVSNVGLGRMVHHGFVFRQNFYIRSYEVGPDGRALVETLMNYLQETFVNHFKTIGLVHDSFGVTPAMCNNNLIWAIAKTQVVVDRYPIWGDVIQIDTWKYASGKNGMSSNWMLSDCKTGDILMRASSIWVMINTETRRLSRIPNEVRAELEKYFLDTPPIIKEDTSNFPELDKSIVYVRNNLTPRWSDLDINQHVNNVKYVEWILEDVPKEILENYELASMDLKYCRECRKDSLLQAHTSVLRNNNDKIGYYNHVDCEQLLQHEIVDGDGEIILKGRTKWRPKCEFNRAPKQCNGD